jgi:hypothetical protein
MRLTIFISSLIILAACQPNTTTNKQLQDQINTLQNKLSDAYKPGMGEFMSSIQVHHEKLWFAGEAGNWPLADFEIGEIKEALDGIKQYDTDRPEAKSLSMIEPAIDSIANAIKQKDPTLFRSSFTLLTNTCNNCHHATNHAFNVIKIPDTPPFSNQVFKAQQ